MPPHAAVVVSDVHLGHAPGSTTARFRAFLGVVPALSAHLIINGDLFDFWFEYRRVIPRSAFRTLSALRELRDKGVSLTTMGGNHDRWGGTFWSEELGAAFHTSATELDIAGRRAFLAHGDGLAESRLASRIMHQVTRHPLTTGLFRLLHPDLGFWLADRLSGALAEQTREGEALDRAAAAQDAFASGLMSRRPELDLVILGHTHRPLVREVFPGRWYLNPGAFMDGGCYAVVDGSGPPVLRRFG